MDIPKYFSNVVLAQFKATGMPLKVYVNGQYLIIPDVYEISDPLLGSGMNPNGEMLTFDYREIDHLLVGGNVIDLATYTKAMTGDTPEEDAKKDAKEDEATEESFKLGEITKDVLKAREKALDAEEDALKDKRKALKSEPITESVNEDYDKMLDRRYGRSRDYNDIEIKDVHFQTDADELEKMKLAYGYRLGGMTSREKIKDAEYELRRYRKTIKYGNGKEVGVFLPGSYDAATSTLGDGPHKSARPKVKWNQRKYDQWLEDVASNDGWKNASDMAQNAKNEPGLIDFVKRSNRGEDPLQRIQWDIEAFAESVNERINPKFYDARVQYIDPKSKKKFVGDVVRYDNGEYKVNLGKDGRFEKYILAKEKDLKIVSKSKKKTFESVNEEVDRPEEKKTAILNAIAKEEKRSEFQNRILNQIKRAIVDGEPLFKLPFKTQADYRRLMKMYKIPFSSKKAEKGNLRAESVNEAWIGPFVFGNTTKDDELKAMYDGALDGYANWKSGMVHPRADYKKAYQAIEKLLKRRGIQTESTIKKGSYVTNKDGLVGRVDNISGDKEIADIRYNDDTEDSLPIKNLKIFENNYTFGIGDIIKNKNTSCPHHGSIGIVQRIMQLGADNPGKIVKYRVVNSGPTYKPGDVLSKTIDQLEPMGL